MRKDQGQTSAINQDVCSEVSADKSDAPGTGGASAYVYTLRLLLYGLIHLSVCLSNFQLLRG
jgi:hypothetical protein